MDKIVLAEHKWLTVEQAINHEQWVLDGRKKKVELNLVVYFIRILGLNFGEYHQNHDISKQLPLQSATV